MSHESPIAPLYTGSCGPGIDPHCSCVKFASASYDAHAPPISSPAAWVRLNPLAHASGWKIFPTPCVSYPCSRKYEGIVANEAFASQRERTHQHQWPTALPPRVLTTRVASGRRQLSLIHI